MGTTHVIIARTICTLLLGLGVAASTVSAAAAPVCGNNITEPGEVCDGNDLNGMTTVDQFAAGYSGGARHCRAPAQDGTSCNDTRAHRVHQHRNNLAPRDGTLADRYRRLRANIPPAGDF